MFMHQGKYLLSIMITACITIFSRYYFAYVLSIIIIDTMPNSVIYISSDFLSYLANIGSK